MPEIPEMENYRLMLSRTVVGKEIVSVVVNRPRSLNVVPEEFVATMAGQVIESITRRAKYLVFHLRDGLFLVTHMMLDGRLYYAQEGNETGLPGRPHVVINFRDNNTLFFCDLRLGYLHILDRAGVTSEFDSLGVEPLSSEFTFEQFKSRFKGRRGAVKPLLMDQKIVAGLGNAYSNEVLFAAGIRPERALSSIEENEMMALWHTIPRVLQKAIEHGGYIEEPFASWDNLSGGQIPHFMVYDRGNQPCKICGVTIQETKLNGRWTYYCTGCQQ